MRLKVMAFAFAVMMLLAIAVVAVGAGEPAAAHGPCEDDGRFYGTQHIAGHPPHGPADQHHNPGTHQGFSLCLGVHE